MRLLRLAVLTAVCVFSGRCEAVTIASDPFTDGSCTNTTGGDTQGLVYYLGQTSGTLTVVDDTGGIGSGNAMLMTPASDYAKYLAFFGPVSLVNPGDFIQLSFDCRFKVTPVNAASGFRFGLYNSNGTKQTGNEGDNAPPDPGTRDDDLGYGVYTNPNAAGTSTSLYSENSGNDILGGAIPSQTAAFGAAGASLASGTTSHHAVLTIIRQTDGSLAASAQLDTGATASGTIPAASVLTYTLDELAIGDSTPGVQTPWFIDNVTITATADQYDRLRTRWSGLITGGTNYSTSDPNIAAAITAITNTATSDWNSMNMSANRTFLWSDLASTTDSSQITSAYSRLRAMALAYATIGSTLQNNAGLQADMTSALDWMYANRYNENATEYDNWYDWEIGTPLLLNDIMVLLFNALTPAQIASYSRPIQTFTPSPLTFTAFSGTTTGANLVAKATVVAMNGVIVKNGTQIASARDSLSNVFLYVTDGDGFYSDGSFIQHTAHPYTGGYGRNLISDLSALMYLLPGSSWAITDPNQANVYSWIYNSFEPVIYDGAMMDFVSGRGVSRSGSQDHGAGQDAIQSILRIAQFASASDAANFKSMVKHWIQADTYRSFLANAPLTQIAWAEAVLNNSTIAPAPELVGHYQFSSMDRVVHLRPGFGFGVSMSSSRIFNYESINTENLHGWYQGDGMTYLYNSDLGQYTNYWPVVDPYRLPGTTVDTQTRANSSGQSTFSGESWVGGAELSSDYGCAGMQLKAYDSSLTAKKSWFMFDDEVVALGAAISGTDGRDVQTTVENRKLDTSGTNTFVMNNSAMPATLPWSATANGVNWCWLDGMGGYYFPGGATLQALRETRTGTWSSINGLQVATSATGNFLTLWFDHGASPTNASYAYVLLPNMTEAATAAYAANPEAVILENSPDAQAVRDNTLNITAINFWNDASKTVDLATSDRKAAVIVQQGTSTIEIAGSDPTQANTGVIHLTIDRGASSVISEDSAVTVTQLSPTIQLSLAVNGTRGRSLDVQFNLQPIEIWRSQYFGNDMVDGADMANPAGDGIPNLMKYALHLDPLSSGATGITMRLSNGAPTLTYTKVKSATDITYQVQVSIDLKTWTSGPTVVAETVLSDNGTIQKISAEDIAPQNGRCFMRLNVTRP